MEALQRLTYLQSPQHAASRTFKLELKKAGRRAKNGFIVALMPLLNILLILGCNAVAVARDHTASTYAVALDRRHPLTVDPLRRCRRVDDVSLMNDGHGVFD
jgi:hypothetical protein